ncbi:MAG: fatty acid hydroxylase [Candidatus Binatia bacterium]
MLPRRTDTASYEVTQPLSRRDRLRADVLARTPRWYSPWVHLAFPSLVGLGMVGASLHLLDGPSQWELLTVPVAFLLVNLNEWHVHRNVLHRRSWPLEALFWRHTPEHHVIFVRDDMAMRSAQEFRLVLIPSYGIVAIFLTTLPITAALWSLVSHDVARLWVATSMGYVVAYEWLHLSYHLPRDHPIARSRAIRWLSRCHATHHTPELMQHWNFNVTVPIADWLLGTIHPDTRRAGA